MSIPWSQAKAVVSYSAPCHWTVGADCCSASVTIHETTRLRRDPDWQRGSIAGELFTTRLCGSFVKPAPRSKSIEATWSQNRRSRCRPYTHIGMCTYIFLLHTHTVFSVSLFLTISYNYLVFIPSIPFLLFHRTIRAFPEFRRSSRIDMKRTRFAYTIFVFPSGKTELNN